MYQILLVVTICQFSSNLLKELSERYTYKLDNESLSPTERSRIERKVYTADFFTKVLRYGSAAYVVLECIYEFLTVFVMG